MYLPQHHPSPYEALFFIHNNWYYLYIIYLGSMRAETLFCSDIYVEETQYMLNKQAYYMAFLAAINSYIVPKDLDSN